MPSWVPDACTLPSADRPLRVAEFDALFSRALRAGERLTPGLLRVTFDEADDATLRDLVARETACCSFFDFTIHREGAGQVVLDVAVPAGHEPVLDALALALTSALATRSEGRPAQAANGQP